MRINWVLVIFAIILVSGFQTLNYAQDPQQQPKSDIRGTFLSSRPNTDKDHSNDPRGMGELVKDDKKDAVKPRNRRRRKPTQPEPPKPAKEILGLGYTLYQRDQSGNPFRVDPNREFHTGDAIRITLEPNADGYIYIFHHETNGQPQMLFPDARLHGGNNAIHAHVPYEIPSSVDANPALHWFFFTGKATTEHVYVLITREPLPDVPISEALVKYCQDNNDRSANPNCVWRPSDQLWAQIKANLNQPVNISREIGQGDLQTEVEQDSIQRGLGLPKEAPAPSIIRMNVTSENDLLITPIDLIHR